MSKGTMYRKPVKKPGDPEALKEATFPIRHVDRVSIERYMAENFGLVATDAADLPDGQPTEEYLIEFKGEKKR